MRFEPGQTVTVVDNFGIPWPKIGDSFPVMRVEDVPCRHAQHLPSWAGMDDGKPCPTPRDMVGHEQWVIIGLPDGEEKRMTGRFFEPLSAAGDGERVAVIQSGCP
jgi:hypothetical protein